MSELSPERVAAIIVTYGPDEAQLHRLLDAISPQVAHVFVVDNSPDSTFWERGGFAGSGTFISMGGNRGIGAAQNVGMTAAIAASADYLLLLDQDSVPGEAMVSNLVAATKALSALGHRVAAVGPSMHGRAGPSGFVRFGRFKYETVHPGPDDEWVECDMLLASGSLISKGSVGEVGKMNEEFFIDKVDTEWCLRARSAGFLFYGVSGARMEHSLGEQSVRAWIFGWRDFAVHEPFRYYYIVRNGLLLSRLPHASSRWRMVERIERIKNFVYFGVASKRRQLNLQMMLKGLVDGVRGLSGPKR